MRFETFYAPVKKSKIYKDLNQYFSDAVLRRAVRHYQNETKLQTSQQFSAADCLNDMKRDLNANPYSLSKIPYVTVEKIDYMVLNLPINHPWHMEPLSQRRVDAMINSVLHEYIKVGTAMVQRYRVLNLVKQKLVLNTPDVFKTEDTVQQLQEKVDNSHAYEVVDVTPENHDLDLIIATNYYHMSNTLADKMTSKLKQSKTMIDMADIEEVFDDLATSEDIHLSDEQQQTVIDMLQNPLSLLTGYAGTGKSTLLKAVVQYLVDHDEKVQMTAISAKACFNLVQLTGQAKAAKTIAGIKYSQRRLNCDYLIIDEISMVPESDFYNLMNLIKADCHVIMIGDIAQLPAVEGVGMLTSLLKANNENNLIPAHNLTHVYRQANDSLLLDIATQIRNKTVPTDLNQRDDTFVGAGKFSLDGAVDAYIEAAKRNGLPNVTFLTQLNRDVELANIKLQHHYQQENKSEKILNRNLYVGDKVLVNRNMYQVKTVGTSHGNDTVNVANGFLGRISETGEINGKTYARVVFDSVATAGDTFQVDFYAGGKGPDDAYSYGDINNLLLGYALTVHKSQGSTINTVIYYLDQSTNPQMLTRQLLYTALTRAKQLFFLTNGNLDESVIGPYVNADAYEHANSYLATALLDA